MRQVRAKMENGKGESMTQIYDEDEDEKAKVRVKTQGAPGKCRDCNTIPHFVCFCWLNPFECLIVYVCAEHFRPLVQRFNMNEFKEFGFRRE